MKCISLLAAVAALTVLWSCQKSVAQFEPPSINVGGVQVSPFYESTPTGRVDGDTGLPATDRFSMPESSSAFGLSFAIGGSGRSMINLPPQFEDLSYDHRVDPGQIGLAWKTSHAARMTDVALQLAEGERVLLRPRKMISAQQAFELAIRFATESNDQESLQRIAKYAADNHDQELSTAVAAALKLSASSRDATAAMIDPLEIDPHAFGLISECFSKIRRAKATGDIYILDAIERDHLPSLPESMRTRLAKAIEDAKQGIQGGPLVSPSLSDGLDSLYLLASSSREWDPRKTGKKIAEGDLVGAMSGVDIRIPTQTDSTQLAGQSGRRWVIQYTLTNQTPRPLQIEFMPTGNRSRIAPHQTISCRSPASAYGSEKTGVRYSYPKVKAIDPDGRYWIRTISKDTEYRVVTTNKGIQIFP